MLIEAINIEQFVAWFLTTPPRMLRPKFPVKHETYPFGGPIWQ